MLKLALGSNEAGTETEKKESQISVIIRVKLISLEARKPKLKLNKTESKKCHNWGETAALEMK